MTHRRQNFMGGAAILALAVAVTKLLGALYKIPLGNLLDREGMAHFYAAYNIYSLLLVLSTAGLPVALSRMVARAAAQRRFGAARRCLRTGLALLGVMGLACSAVMCLLPDTLAAALHDGDAASALRALGPAVLLVCLSAALRGYSQGLGDMVPTAAGQVAESAGKLLIGLGLCLYLLRQGAGTDLCAAGAMVLLLLPMVRKILSFDYAGRYSYYNFGGITLELAAQTLRIGLLNFILIGMGLWFAAKRRLPALPCLAGTELLVSLVLFTRVQNTGSHQMLLFVPGWLLLFLVGSAALADGLKKHTAVKLCYWGFTMVFAVSVRCSPLTTVALPGFVVDHFPLKAVSEFVRLDKLTYDRTDAAQIQRVDDWIDAHCDAEKGEFAYMIPHDMLYNSDMFQYAALPDIQLQGKLAAGISIPGTHEFPVRFFEAKYVLTAEPLPQTFVSGGELDKLLAAGRK